MYIDLARQRDDILRTGHHTQRTSLATGGVNYNCTFHFSHNICYFGVIISFEVRKGSNNSRIGKKNNEF